VKNKERFRPKPWLPEEIKQLRALAKLHETKEIARIMGKSFETVRWQMRKHRIRSTRADVYTYTEMATLDRVARAHGLKETARRYNMNVTTLKGVLLRYRAKRGALAEGLTEPEVRRIRAVASNFARKSGRIDEMEEFASYCCLLRLTRKAIVLETAWLDFICQRNGDWGTEVGRAQQFAEKHMAQVTESADPLDGVQVAARDQSPSKTLQIAEALNLKPLDRALFILYFQEGYLGEQLARVFGITAAGISFRLAKMTDAAKERAQELGALLAD
jgi:DNA-binding CsgD family transcriptional regulator